MTARQHFREGGAAAGSWREKGPRSRATEQKHRRDPGRAGRRGGQTDRDKAGLGLPAVACRLPAARPPPSEGHMPAGRPRPAGPRLLPWGLLEQLPSTSTFCGSSRVLGALQRLSLILTRVTFTPFFTGRNWRLWEATGFAEGSSVRGTCGCHSGHSDQTATFFLF